MGGLIRLKTTLPQGRLKGVIQSLDEPQVSIAAEKGERLSVPWSAVKGLQVQTGLRRMWGTGLLITTGVGALLGLAKPDVATTGVGNSAAPASAIVAKRKKIESRPAGLIVSPSSRARESWPGF